MVFVGFLLSLRSLLALVDTLDEERLTLGFGFDLLDPLQLLFAQRLLFFFELLKYLALSLCMLFLIVV
jgi:hypothetical protein